MYALLLQITQQNVCFIIIKKQIIIIITMCEIYGDYDYVLAKQIAIILEYKNIIIIFRY